MGKRLSGYAVFALFFLIVVKAVRFFRPAARRRDGLLFSRGFCGLWDIWRGRPRGGGAPIPQGGSEADSISFDFAGSCHRLLFLLMDYREYAMLRQVTALLGGAA